MSNTYEQKIGQRLNIFNEGVGVRARIKTLLRARKKKNILGSGLHMCRKKKFLSQF